MNWYGRYTVIELHFPCNLVHVGAIDVVYNPVSLPTRNVFMTCAYPVTYIIL
jgi:hypothetical protein